MDLADTDERGGKLLSQCFDIGDETRIIALVGAGGKTSLMYAFAREFSKAGAVMTSTTTKIRPPGIEQSPCLVLLKENRVDILDELKRFGHITVANRLLANGKLAGLDENYFVGLPPEVRRIIVEADGAAGLPVKAPESWEPALPLCSDLVVPVVGLDCLGKRATKENAFRLERFLRVTSLHENEYIDPPALARLLTHPEGALYKVPRRARIVPFLNKLDRLDSEDPVMEIIRQVKNAGSPIKRIVYGSLKSASNTINLRHAEW